LVKTLQRFATFNSSGYLGLGTATIPVRLTINGTLKVADGGETASTAGAGSIKWNSGSTALQYSNGTSWLTLAATGLPTVQISYQVREPIQLQLEQNL